MPDTLITPAPSTTAATAAPGLPARAAASLAPTLADSTNPPGGPQRWVPRHPPEGPALTALLQAAGGIARVADRALGAYLGLALGDALGATVEFMTPREIALRHGVHRRIIGGGWLRLKPGQVTDDTTMSLALGEALLRSARGQERHGLELRTRAPRDIPQGSLAAAVSAPPPVAHDLREVAEGFLAWWRGRPVDCGNTCRRGILRYLHDGSLQGPSNDGDGGNGAVMRLLPAALATLGDPDGYTALALGQARITHHHPLSDRAVLEIGRLTQALVLGATDDLVHHRIADWVATDRVFRFDPYPGRASGYVVDTVQTVLHTYTRHAGFEDAVVAAVNQGDDADTTGAIVGMLAGARCGASGLPRDWLARLQPAVLQAVTDQASALVALALQPLDVPASPQGQHG